MPAPAANPISVYVAVGLVMMRFFIAFQVPFCR
jgi:hypothetical protein